MKTTGYTSAQFNIEKIYYRGEGGVSQNFGKALEHYANAANKWDAGAYGALANMYFKGRGIPVNHKKAYTHVLIANELIKKKKDPEIADRCDLLIKILEEKLSIQDTFSGQKEAYEKLEKKI